MIFAIESPSDPGDDSEVRRVGAYEPPFSLCQAMRERGFGGDYLK